MSRRSPVIPILILPAALLAAGCSTRASIDIALTASGDPTAAASCVREGLQRLASVDPSLWPPAQPTWDAADGRFAWRQLAHDEIGYEVEGRIGAGRIVVTLIGTGPYYQRLGGFDAQLAALRGVVRGCAGPPDGGPP